MFKLTDEASEFKKQESLASIVKRLGNPESTTLLHATCNVFKIPQVDGAIGYYQMGNCVAVIGDPICLPQYSAILATAFHRYCQECNLKTVYLLTHHDFAKWAINNGCQTLIQVGSELSINPTIFQIKHHLRWKVNQSIQHGVQVKEYKKFDPFLENQIKKTVQTWVRQRHGPQIHLGLTGLFNCDVEKRIFYAQHNDKMIGVLILTPVDRFHGWVINAYLALLDAPGGTSEHLMCVTFDTLAEENCHFLCLGVISGTQLGEVIGLSPLAKTLANLFFKTARWYFKLDKKALYLNKYHPYLRSIFLLTRDKLTIAELLTIKHVLNVKLW